MTKERFNPVEFLSHLRDLDINIWADENRLRYSAPEGALTADLRAELSQRKEELLAFLRQAEAATRVGPASIRPVSRAEKLPLSFGQQRLWFLQQLRPESPAYNIPIATRLAGPLDVTALEQSLGEMIRRHESLRTTIEIKDDQPVQIIGPAPSDYRLEIVDCQASQLHSLMDQMAARPFDLARGPLMLARLLRLDPTEHILLLNFHHIIFDGWSLDIFNRELSTLYNDYRRGHTVSLPVLPIQYADFAQWEKEHFQQTGSQRLAYWRQQLAGPLRVLQLPTDRPRPAVERWRGASHSFSLSRSLTEALRQLSRRQNATLFMTLAAAFKTLLHRYSGQEDILIGFPTANRNRSELERLIGFFVNTVVLRTGLSGNPSFETLLQRVREATLEASAHQDIPFERLVNALQPERDLSQQPLFQVMFILQNTAQVDLSLPGLRATSWLVDNKTAKMDLTLEMVEGAKGLEGSFEYSTDLFEAATIERMAGHFQTLLAGIAANPAQRLSDLPLLTDAERQRLLVEWNDTAVDWPGETALHRLFETQVERRPQAIAVEYGLPHSAGEERGSEVRLTYAELNRRANQLAHHLQALGVGPETPVGLCVERSVELMVGLLGILKAGGAYVPFDPAYPPERLAFMLDDARPPIVITRQRLLEILPDSEARRICLDTDWPEIAQNDPHNPASGVTGHNLAYTIYTSGSTGRPKGVQIPHRAVINLLQAMRRAPGLSPRDVLLTVANPAFDMSVPELFLALIAGARMIITDPDVISDSARLLACLEQYGVTFMQATPVAWRLLIEAGWSGSDRLKAICGAELLPPELVAQLLERLDCFWNFYGPTETTVWSSAYKFETIDRAVPIGQPLANTQIYLLDQKLNPVPVGVPGELYIGGQGVARGDSNRPALTAERFMPDPFSHEPNARMYRTGDLARFLPDGNIEHLGRLDHQVKLRGYRIELGEIETRLKKHPAIRAVVASIREDSDGDKRLAAYLVSKQQPPPSTSELRHYLAEGLPDYMIPAAFVFLAELPLTPNGKINRQALPAPDSKRPSLDEKYAAPRNRLEAKLAAIWADLLGLERVGIQDNFFELGGDLLQSTQLASRLGAVTQRHVSVKDIFLYPTIAALHDLLAETGEPADDQAVDEPAPARPAKAAASPFLQIEERPLLSLYAAGRLAPVEAAAIGCLPDGLLARTAVKPDDFIEHFCHHLPLFTDVLQTEFGRIALIYLPLFVSELYRNQARLVERIVEALEMAGLLGAQFVSLTGLIPSATDYGRAIQAAVANRTDLPLITTGHATTTAAVVMNIAKILQQSGRDLARERVGILGLGSIGSASLRLMLKALPHPPEIIFCDVYKKAALLEKIKEEIINDLNFQGNVRILKAGANVPADFYEASLILGATNVPEVLNVAHLKPGTLIVDDSWPHCYNSKQAIERLENRADLLFTEGGVLQSPEPIYGLQYIPAYARQTIEERQLKLLFPPHRSQAITGCILSSLLSAHFADLKPTVGLVEAETSWRHYQMLAQLKFGGANLHCEDYGVSEEVAGLFRDRYGQ